MSAIGVTRNLTVVARNVADGLYYSGYITGTKLNIPNKEKTKKGVYHVKFHLITHQNVHRRHVIIVGGATPWPELKRGNYVLVRVKSKLPYPECYAPGIVVAAAIRANLEHRLFRIRLFNGHTITKQRSCIIKIGPDRYSDILDNIARLRLAKNSLIQTVTAPSTRTKLIKKDTIVLAKWLDDGWFYFGRITTVPDVSEKEVYTVVDANDHPEKINREDIFTGEEQMFEAVQPHDHVVGLHPDYAYSYAPGKVTEIYDKGVRVHFFDDAERRLPWSEVYKITSDKYEDYVQYIAERLNSMRVKVIARDDTTGKYRQYIAESTEVKTQQIELKLPETNSKIKQLAIHVFPMVSSTHHNEQSWQYVIAPIDPNCSTYLPAKVTNTKPFKLAYCDGTVYDEVKQSQCFFINVEYYKNATNYFKHFNMFSK